MSPRFPLLVAFILAVTACSGSTEVEDGAGAAGSGGSGGASGSGAAGAQGGSSSSSASGGAGGENFGACSGPGQCVVTTPGCCGSCGAPTVDSVAAVNGDLAEEYFDSTCPDPENTPCPGCASFPNGNLYAHCDAGQCKAADLRVEEFSECAQPSDCTLRFGTGCCEACSGTWETSYGGDLVAVNTSKLGGLTDLVCPPGDIACPDCAPMYPPDAAADCVAGRCTVVQLETP